MQRSASRFEQESISFAIFHITSRTGTSLQALAASQRRRECEERFYCLEHGPIHQMSFEELYIVNLIDIGIRCKYFPLL